MKQVKFRRPLASSILAKMAIELFFIFLPLAIMWWYWDHHLDHAKKYSPSFFESAELSMTSAVLYGLTMLKLFESTFRFPKTIGLVGIYLFVLAMFVVSIIAIGEVSRETTSITAPAQCVNLIIGAMAFFILGGRSEASERNPA